jgi:hypothetical protein
MNLDRRTFTAMLAGTAVAPLLAPRLAFAQGAATKSAFYSGVGPELTHYEVDPDAATLTKRGSVKMGGTIQYAWPHPSRKYLYVTASSGGPGGSGGNDHYLGAFTISPSGELAPHATSSSSSTDRSIRASTKPANTCWSPTTFRRE